ncbi:hypothetical protein J0383_19800 [Flavobacterium endoglycinae]|uniref:Lipoprotein n=1 Tax=Flavobacterium endoglycinae TaxID=2816357 RepID=A0ABX7QD91_9FLAO|nr:hypothetical protein [Flavobacterium endoglycinae]QSW88478.1 hypothetical protein J0383_19800 [Flavobacterium endoglycinae]
MKNLLLTGLIIFLGSCSNDDFDNSDSSAVSKETNKKERSSDLKKGTSSEDNFGEVRAGNYILLIPARIKGRVMSVLRDQVFSGALKISEKNNPDLDTISSDGDPVGTLLIIADESALGSSLKLDVKGYIVNLGNLRGQQYHIVDDFIIQYEISKRQDSTLLTNEKETILSISSISEAVLFSEKARKDRDWETSTTSKRNGN